MAAAALLIGAGIQAYGSYQEGEEKAFALRSEAAAKRAQAAQVEIQANREADLTQRQFERVRGAQLSAWGRSGVQVNTGSPLQRMEETAANAMDEIRAIRDAGRYRKTSLLTGAGYDEYNAQGAQDAAFLNMLGAGFGAYSKNPYAYDAPRRGTPGGSGGGIA